MKCCGYRYDYVLAAAVLTASFIPRKGARCASGLNQPALEANFDGKQLSIKAHSSRSGVARYIRYWRGRELGILAVQRCFFSARPAHIVVAMARNFKFRAGHN